MKIFVPRATVPEETRVGLVPDGVKALVAAGADLIVEAGSGRAAGIVDSAYAAAGATLTADRGAALAGADLVVGLDKPSAADVAQLRPGAIVIGFLAPFEDPALLAALARAGVAAIAMELIPRTTLAQKMDALSSQANLAGYAAVVLAAARLNRAFPMMMTPAGTISPARVLVVGAGVAGLQAIATAKRLGARVEAYDTRPAAAEQIRSLGARAVEIDLGATRETSQGYAAALSAEQIRIQQQTLARHCASADALITTAQVFGKRAPVIVTEAMVKGMAPGSVIVDVAADTGGNVASSRPGEEIEVHGVRILAFRHLARFVPAHASQMYSANVVSLIQHFWDNENKTFALRLDDEILRQALATHAGNVVSPVLATPQSGGGPPAA